VRGAQAWNGADEQRLVLPVADRLGRKGARVELHRQRRGIGLEQVAHGLDGVGVEALHRLGAERQGLAHVMIECERSTDLAETAVLTVLKHRYLRCAPGCIGARHLRAARRRGSGPCNRRRRIAALTRPARHHEQHRLARDGGGVGRSRCHRDGRRCRSQRARSAQWDDLGGGEHGLLLARLALAIDAGDHALSRREGEHLRGLRQRRTLAEHLPGVEIAHHALLLGQVPLDRAGGLQFVVDALDQAALLGVAGPAGDHPGRRLRRGQQRRRRQPDVRREHARLGDGAVKDRGEAQIGIADHLGHDPLRHPVEPGRRIDHAAPDVVVGNQLLVVAVGQLRAATGELDEPVGAGSDLDLHVGQLAQAEVAQGRVAAGDAPLGGAVDVVLGLRLGGVEGLQRVGVVVAQHAGAVDRGGPILDGQRLHHVVVPAAHLLRRPAPQAVAGVQNVVLEILEVIVGCLGPFQIELGVGQEHALPIVRIGALQMPQRVKRELVMRAVGVGAVDNMEDEMHGAFPVSPEPIRGIVARQRRRVFRFGERVDSVGW
jgi:hypothetical protein